MDLSVTATTGGSYYASLERNDNFEVWNNVATAWASTVSAADQEITLTESASPRLREYTGINQGNLGSPGLVTVRIHRVSDRGVVGQKQAYICDNQEQTELQFLGYTATVSSRIDEAMSSRAEATSPMTLTAEAESDLAAAVVAAVPGTEMILTTGAEDQLVSAIGLAMASVVEVNAAIGVVDSTTIGGHKLGALLGKIAEALIAKTTGNIGGAVAQTEVIRNLEDSANAMTIQTDVYANRTGSVEATPPNIVLPS